VAIIFTASLALRPQPDLDEAADGFGATRPAQIETLPAADTKLGAAIVAALPSTSKGKDDEAPAPIPEA
jgi:hypothetical protein